MKKFALIFSALHIAAGCFAGNWIVYDAQRFAGHLQGIAADTSGIYWSFYDTLLKTDYSGKKICSTPVVPHSGDLCVVAGKLFVSITIYGKQNIAARNGHRAWIFEYDANTLEFIAAHQLPQRSPDAITFANGKFYVGGDGVRDYHPDNPIYVYDRNFKLLQVHRVDIGHPTRYGAQTMNFVNGKIMVSFYGDPAKKSYFFDPDDFSRVESRFPVRTSFGAAPVPEQIAGEKDVFLIAHNLGKKRDWAAKLQVVKYSGGKLQPFQRSLIALPAVGK